MNAVDTSLPEPIVIPDNIEELIEAYLRQQAQRLIDADLAYCDMINVSAHLTSFYREGTEAKFDSRASTNLLQKKGPPATDGKSIAEAVSAHIEKAKHYDPVGEKLAEINRLKAEIAALEGGSK